MKSIDRLKSLEKCSQKAVKLGGNWPKVWDPALHLGTRHLRGLQTLSRLMFHHGRGSKPCPLCEENKLCSRLLDHVLTAHQHKIGFQGVSESADNLTCTFGGMQHSVCLQVLDTF